MNCSRMTLFPLLVVAVLGWKTAIANPHRDPLRHDYEARRHALKQSLRLQTDAIRCQYRDMVRDLAAARRGALRFCEPERRTALDQIKEQRRAASFTYHQQLRFVRGDVDLALDRLKNSYDLARRQLHHRHQVTFVRTSVTHPQALPHGPSGSISPVPAFGSGQNAPMLQEYAFPVDPAVPRHETGRPVGEHPANRPRPTIPSQPEAELLPPLDHDAASQGAFPALKLVGTWHDCFAS